MELNISIEKLNKFAPEGFTFEELPNGCIDVIYDSDKSISQFEHLGATQLKVSDLPDIFRGFYNFTHIKEDGKLKEAPLEVSSKASAAEADKNITKFMNSRIADFNKNKKRGLSLTYEDEFARELQDKLPVLDSYRDIIGRRIENINGGKELKARQTELSGQQPQKGFLSVGYQKKYEQWAAEVSSVAEAIKNNDKEFVALSKDCRKLSKEFKDNYYGDFFTQVVLRSALNVVREDVKKHYQYLSEQHTAADIYNKRRQVEEKLKKLGASHGEVSGAVETDRRARETITGKETPKVTRENKLDIARNNLMEKTFGRR